MIAYLGAGDLAKCGVFDLQIHSWPLIFTYRGGVAWLMNSIARVFSVVVVYRFHAIKFIFPYLV